MPECPSSNVHRQSATAWDPCRQSHPHSTLLLTHTRGCFKLWLLQDELFSLQVLVVVLALPSQSGMSGCGEAMDQRVDIVRDFSGLPRTVPRSSLQQRLQKFTASCLVQSFLLLRLWKRQEGRLCLCKWIFAMRRLLRPLWPRQCLILEGLTFVSGDRVMMRCSVFTLTWIVCSGEQCVSHLDDADVGNDDEEV